jgi:CxxC motif-containing protein (DUF1111 family)
MLIRISIPGEDVHGGPLGDPSYGDQLQIDSLAGVPAEAKVRVYWEAQQGAYDEGTPYTLRTPRYGYEDLAFGSLADDLRASGRTAPHMSGLGLLEAIPEETLSDWADPEDGDGDEISGRLNWVWDSLAPTLRPGRVGWKAEQPTVRQQVAGALLGDMGITSPVFQDQNCPPPQIECAAAPSGGEPEIGRSNFSKLVFYSSTLAPPTRDDYDDPIAHHLRDEWTAKGYPNVAVYADAWASLNGR